ncbi:MAG: glycosyltransferase family 2 protein [Candidatus Woesearchaeota archaeon]
MSSSSLVSIIIPMYNSQETIIKTVLSALSQTYENTEILIINDGSTDNSLSILKSIKNKKIKIYSQRNKGPSAARNYGAKKAKGEFLSFLDADDTWLENKIETEIKLILKKNISCIISGVNIYVNSHVSKKISKKNISHSNLFVFNYGVCGSNLTIKKEFFLNYQYKSEFDGVEDYELLLRITEKNNLLSTNKYLVNYFYKPVKKRKYWNLLFSKIESKKMKSSLYFDRFTQLLYERRFSYNLLWLSFINSPSIFYKKILFVLHIKFRSLFFR